MPQFCATCGRCKLEKWKKWNKNGTNYCETEKNENGKIGKFRQAAIASRKKVYILMCARAEQFGNIENQT